MKLPIDAATIHRINTSIAKEAIEFAIAIADTNEDMGGYQRRISPACEFFGLDPYGNSSLKKLTLSVVSLLESLIEHFETEWRGTRNPILIWQAIEASLLLIKLNDRKLGHRSLSFALPMFCFEYLENCAGEVTARALIRTNRNPGFRMRPDGRPVKDVPAGKLAREIPEVFGFIYGRSKNAFTEFRRFHEDVAVTSIDEYHRMTGKGIGRAIEETFQELGIKDETTIRRKKKRVYSALGGMSAETPKKPGKRSRGNTPKPKRV